MSILDDFRMTGKTAIVTGAGRGIGQAVALAYAQGGANLVLNDLDEAAVRETAALAEKEGVRSAVVTGSVADYAVAERLVGAAVETFGGLDAMANIAGITRDRMSHKMDEETWDFVIDVNLKGTFNCCKAALTWMRDKAKSEGENPPYRRIVNTSSIAGLFGNAGQANYSAAKMGIVGLTKTFALEGLASNVIVNCVAPGWVDTRLTAEKKEGADYGIPQAQRQQTLMYMQFMKIRTGQPVDLARTIYYLSSDACTYMTGQTLNVSGGLRM